MMIRHCPYCNTVNAICFWGSTLLALAGALGIAVARRGCNACGARLFGESW